MDNTIRFNDFSNGLLVKRKVYEQLMPGTKVENSDNVRVIIKQNGEIYDKGDGYIVSPQLKKGLFSKKERPDPNRYEIIFFNTANFMVTTGTSVEYIDKKVNNVKVHAGIPCKLICRLSNPYKFLRIYNVDDEFYIDDIKPIINDKVNSVNKASIAEILNRRGTVAAQEELTFAAEEVKQALNMDNALPKFGIVVESVVLDILTDDVHETMVYDANMSEYFAGKVNTFSNKINK